MSTDFIDFFLVFSPYDLARCTVKPKSYQREGQPHKTEN